MKNTIIFVLVMFLCSGAWAQELIGKARISKTGNKTHTWISYSVRSPFIDLTDVWIRISVSVEAVETPAPETLECGLKINNSFAPPYEYAQYRDGALYLYFEKIKNNTLLEFAIGYKNVAAADNYFQEAALSLKSNEWKTSAKWQLIDDFISMTANPMSIVIDGKNSCYLYQG